MPERQLVGQSSIAKNDERFSAILIRSVDRRLQRARRICYTAAAAFIVFGVALLVHLAFQARYGAESVSWPMTIAWINSSEIRYPAKRRLWTAPYAQVQYSYTVGGVSYSGDRLSFGAPLRIRLQLIVERYHPGGTAEVRYDPSNPARSVLVPGFRWSENWNETLPACAAFATAFVIMKTRPKKNG
jgi:hypothetical protein